MANFDNDPLGQKYTEEYGGAHAYIRAIKITPFLIVGTKTFQIDEEWVSAPFVEEIGEEYPSLIRFDKDPKGWGFPEIWDF